MTNLDLVESVAAAATASDAVAPLDEDTWLWLRAADEQRWAHSVVTAEGFLLRRDEQLHLCVHPEHRRAGIGTRLLGEVSGPAQAWSHGNHPGAARLGARFGFERVRDLWVMRRPLLEPLPETTRTLRSFVAEDLPEVLRVNAAAFAHHPEQGALDADGFAARAAEGWFDPRGLILAFDGEELLGFHWTKRHDEKQGEVYVVAVDPRAQGLGLGRDLTLAGLRHLRESGLSEVLLYVESDNVAALKTYAALGFTHAAADTHVMYARR